MTDERTQRLGEYTMLKEKIWETATRAQALVQAIQEEVNNFIDEKDFSNINFKKVETLSVELQQLQESYKEKVERSNKLKSTYKF